MNVDDMVAVQGDLQETAGNLVFWALSGSVDIDDLLEQATAEGIDEDLHPNPPTLDVAAKRAAESVLKSHKHGRRLMLRPLRRGTWDVVQETVVVSEEDLDELVFESLIRISVLREEGEKVLYIRPLHEAARELATLIGNRVAVYRGLLTANDMSAWLLKMLNGHVRAVSLRGRGGIYFVPRDRVQAWQSVVNTVREVSDHKLYLIPAMQSDEAVEAILSGIRKEAATAMSEMEAYLSGETVSTRGLNAWERDLKELRAKTKHYAELLGVELPEIIKKAETLGGALTAARISKKALESAS